MAFDLDIVESVGDYLVGLSVSPGVRDKIADALELVGQLSEEFRADPQNRWARTLLRFSYVFLADGQVHTIIFAIDDSQAAFGVLRIPHARYVAGSQMTP
jgi:hypothetical protein